MGCPGGHTCRLSASRTGRAPGVPRCSWAPGETLGPGLLRVKANLSEVLVSSVLGVNLTSAEDYGAFTCSVQNVSSASFTLWRAGEGVPGLGMGGRGAGSLEAGGGGEGAAAQDAALSPAPAGHLAAVLASLLVLLALLLAALLYLKCRLNVQLWYQNAYGEVEMNGAWATVRGRTACPGSAGGGFRGGDRDAPALEGSGEHTLRKEGLHAGQEATGPGSAAGSWFEGSPRQPVLGRGREERVRGPQETAPGVQAWAWTAAELTRCRPQTGSSTTPTSPTATAPMIASS